MKELDVQKQKKISHLRHYLGGVVSAFDPEHATVGQLEQIDLEDGSVCIKANNESHWFDSSIVDASLKKFKHLTADDVITLVEAMVFNSEGIHRSEVISIEQHGGTDIFVKILDGSIVHINDMFWITRDKTPVDNIGEIILLLCDMGFDVRSNAD